MTEARSPEQTEAKARATCERTLASMATLRSFEVPGTDAEPPDVHEALGEMRARLDAAEVLMKEILRFKGECWARSDALAALADDAYDAAWDKAVQSNRGREFEGVKDREVAARMASLAERRRARAARTVARLADNAHARAQVDYYGLLNIREELLTRLSRYLPWLASMET